MKRAFLSLIVLQLMFVQGKISSQVTAVPPLMNFQGRLTKLDGTPVPNGNYPVRFSLWTAVTGGTEKWNQTINPVTVRNGTFVVLLNVGTGPADLWNDNRWLEIKIGTAAPLTPRQQLVSVAFALKANTVPDNAITSAKIANGTITGADIANGTITNINLAAGTLNFLSWQLAGNSGATNGFLGTTDNQPLELRVNGRRAMRYSYAENSNFHSINVLGGSEFNEIADGIVGATIAGGGYDPGGANGSSRNRVLDDFGTVGGGAANTASHQYATVAGGAGNSASDYFATVGGGLANLTIGNFATVAGGYLHTTRGDSATVGGGYLNTASNQYATIAGGIGNNANGDSATVSGGDSNTADGVSATVGGGGGNIARGNYATVTGGLYNTALGNYSFAAGHRAITNHEGAFVWADNTGTDFASTAANQFLIRASGGIGINTNAPNSHLAVQGSAGNARFQIGGTGGDANHLSSGRDFVFNATGGLFTFRSISDINDLASYTDQFVIQSNGNASLRGLLFQFSDRRYKTHVSTFPDALDAILNLRGVTYEWDRAQWKERGFAEGRQIGFIAQEVEKVLPELVTTDSKGYKSIAYTRVVPVLVEAVKTQHRKVETLAQENRELKKRQAATEVENAQLKARLTAIEQALAELKTQRK